MMQPRRVSFDEVIRLISDLRLKEFRPDCVVAVGRGGLVPASLVASRLSLPLVQVGARLYNDEMPAKRVNISPEIDLRGFDFGGKCVLVVDDVSNSGETLASAKRQLSEAGAKEVRSFVLFGKSDCSDRPFEKCVLFPWQERS